MFPYFGKKLRLAKFYPAPAYSTVIEPFAGTMAYSLHYRPERAVGIERDERVFALWQRAQKVTGNEPPPKIGSKTDDLLVKLCSYSEHALTSGTMTVTSRMVRDWSTLHRRMATDSKWTRKHIKYLQGSYEDAEDIEATWFIDPPYQYANRRGYKYGASKINYEELAKWVKSRQGQVIVCEQEGADWLPFQPLCELRTHRGTRTSEVVYIQNKTSEPELATPSSS